MRRHFNRFRQQLLHLSMMMGLGALCLGSSCNDKEAELEKHRPRLDRPWFQEQRPLPKPLSGLFVDVNTKASSPDGKSWATAFLSIQQAIDVSTGQDIYVAAGIYKNPNLNLRDKTNIRLVGGYKSGEKFEKDRHDLKADEWVELDGRGLRLPLVQIMGKAKRITFAGGFIFQNVRGSSAVIIRGDNAKKPVKEITIINSKFQNTNNNTVGGNGGGIVAQFVKNLRLDDLVAERNMANNLGWFYVYHRCGWPLSSWWNLGSQ